MNRLKQLGIVLIAIALVTSAIFGPGAFTSLSADRQSDVDVVGDADAFIGLQPGDGPGGEYATYEDGRLRVALDGSITDGAGVNRGALTRVERVFTISNNGAGPVALWLENEQTGITFEHSDDDRPIEDQENAVALEPGETIPIGIVVDAVESELDGDDVLEDVRIVADSDLSEVTSSEPTETDGGSPQEVKSSTWQSAESSSSPESSGSSSDDSDCSPTSFWKCDSDDVKDAAGGARDTVTNTFNRENAGKVKDRFVDGGRATVDETISAGKWLGNGAINTGKGLIWGQTGQPGGFVYECDFPVCVSHEEATSNSYLLGWTGSGFLQIGDLRDFGQNSYNGQWVDASIDFAGLIPGGTAVKTYNKYKHMDKIKTTNQHEYARWIDGSPNRVEWDYMNSLSHGAAGDLAEAGMSKQVVVQSSKNGWDLRDMRRLKDSHDVPVDHLKYYGETGVDPGFIKSVVIDDGMDPSYAFEMAKALDRADKGYTILDFSNNYCGQQAHKDNSSFKDICESYEDLKS